MQKNPNKTVDRKQEVDKKEYVITEKGEERWVNQHYRSNQLLTVAQVYARCECETINHMSFTFMSEFQIQSYKLTE